MHLAPPVASALFAASKAVRVEEAFYPPVHPVLLHLRLAQLVARPFPLPVPEPHKVVDRVPAFKPQAHEKFRQPKEAYRRLGIRHVRLAVAVILPVRGRGPYVP